MKYESYTTAIKRRYPSVPVRLAVVVYREGAT